MKKTLLDEIHATLKECMPFLKMERYASWNKNTSAGVGLAPFFLVEPAEEHELKQLLSILQDFSVRIVPLGAGTNFIGSDQEVSSLFLRLDRNAFSRVREKGNSVLECGGAIRLTALAEIAAEKSLGGISALSGIPGTLGGAVKMNAGANGYEISEFIREIHGISLKDGTEYLWRRGDDGFGYRSSPLPEEVIVTSVLLQMLRVDTELEKGWISTEKTRRAAVTPKGRSAGSTFRNPPGGIAGRLLEKAGCKDLSCGACRVSSQHANWITIQADSSASEQDFLSVLTQMRQAVWQKYKKNLLTELCFANESSERMAGESMEKKLKILVLKGGTSSEREVSLISGAAVANALRQAGHDVTEYDIQEPVVTEEMRQADVIYPVLHGGFGEDGTLQKAMENAGLKFVGCPSQACIDAMDKVVSKQIMDREGIRNAKYFVTDSAETPLPETFELPLVVKPPCEGSTFGLTLVEKPDQWKPALELALKYDKTALVEQYISGIEATVGIIDGAAMPVIEIRYPGKLYDYDAKYTHANGETQYLCPPVNIPEPAQMEAQKLALKFYRAVGARDMLRVDMIIDDQGKTWILEGNTLPGCTPSSLLPKAAKIAGISFPEMCSTLANAAYNR